MVQKCNKVQPKHGKFTQNMHGASRNYRYVWDVSEPSCPIILGRPFLRTVGAIIDMKEGTIKFQFPLKKGMEHFPRKKIKLPFESVTRASYFLDKT